MRAATHGGANRARLNPDSTDPGVAGRTGSAECSEELDAPRAWFIGRLPAESPRVVGGLAPHHLSPACTLDSQGVVLQAAVGQLYSERFALRAPGVAGPGYIILLPLAPAKEPLSP